MEEWINLVLVVDLVEEEVFPMILVVKELKHLNQLQLEH